MYCPNCGKVNSVEQKFCRGCGMSLETVVQALDQQFPATDAEKNLQDGKRKIERLMIIAGGTAGSILLFGVLWGIIYKIMIGKGEILFGLMFLVFIIGLLLFATLSLFREFPFKKSAKHQLPQEVVAQPKDTARLLPDSHREPLPSVTERTTDLLALEGKRGDLNQL